jgi:hypothetical protein
MTKDVEIVHEDTFDPRMGYDITVSMWSDNRWTAYISRTEPVHGAERVIMDNDVVWDERPDESDLHDYVDCYLEG